MNYIKPLNNFIKFERYFISLRKEISFNLSSSGSSSKKNLPIDLNIKEGSYEKNHTFNQYYKSCL